MNNVGLYVHIPFCKSKCPYCDFYSLTDCAVSYDEYTLSVIECMEKYRDSLNLKCDTLYFGGGTPSLIGAENLCRITNRAKMLFGIDGEITVECNPGGLSEDFFFELADSGVNRISLGLQSAVDSERRKLGRASGREVIEKRISLCRSAGIENISLDIMLGIPGQNLNSLSETVSFCKSLDIPHLSAYILKIEEGTYFYSHKEKFCFPDDDDTADMYEYLCSELRSSGYTHYEISNFAKPGFEGKHNLKYWKCQNYLGIGPGAHSFIGNKRFFYPKNVYRFISEGDTEFDSFGGDESEYVMLALRLSDGLNFNSFYNRFGYCLPESLVKKIMYFEKSGFMKMNCERASLTEKGMLVSNTVISEIISCL